MRVSPQWAGPAGASGASDFLPVRAIAQRKVVIGAGRGISLPSSATAPVPVDAEGGEPHDIAVETLVVARPASRGSPLGGISPRRHALTARVPAGARATSRAAGHSDGP